MTLKTLAALQEKATKGPWNMHSHRTYPFDIPEQWVGYAWVGFGGESDGRFDGKLACLDRRKDCFADFQERAEHDAAFIAACGSFDFAAICDEMERMRKALEMLRAQLVENGYSGNEDEMLIIDEALGGKDE